jgi:hypothetical protein
MGWVLDPFRIHCVRNENIRCNGRQAGYKPAKQCGCRRGADQLCRNEASNIRGANATEDVTRRPCQSHGRIGKRCRCREPVRRCDVRPNRIGHAADQ